MGLKFRPYVRAECPKKAQGEKQAGWWISETKYVRLGRAGNSPQIHPLLFRHHFAVCTLCFRRSSPRREFAAGRDGVRRRHAGVRPLDAGPPRALADHQPRLVTPSSAADYSSSSLLICFLEPRSAGGDLGSWDPCSSWAVVTC